MLFNKKLLIGMCHALGVLLLFHFLLNIAMYIWAFFGVPPLPFFDVKGGVASYYVFLYREATLLFFYMVVGTAAGMIKSSKLSEKF